MLSYTFEADLDSADVESNDAGLNLAIDIDIPSETLWMRLQSSLDEADIPEWDSKQPISDQVGRNRSMHTEFHALMKQRVRITIETVEAIGVVR